jgi:hypothetical protein
LCIVKTGAICIKEIYEITLQQQLFASTNLTRMFVFSKESVGIILIVETLKYFLKDIIVYMIRNSHTFVISR